MKEKLNDIILVPTDFSEVCQNAINHGVEIAEYLNCKVCLLHVINRETKTQLKKEQESIEAIEKKLKAIADKIYENTKVEVEYLYKEGSIFDIIHKTASDIKAQLVILGTHGKKGLQHLFGSHALKVITNAPVPTIVVQKRAFGDGYKNIVFPINDFTEARQKLNWAIHIGKKFNSTIHIFQQEQNDPGLLSRIKIITKQVEEAFKKFDVDYKLIQAEKKANFTKQLLTYAVQNNTDLIMILTGPDMYSPDFDLGPWDEKIMFNQAQIPVMCINPIECGSVYYEYITLI